MGMVLSLLIYFYYASTYSQKKKKFMKNILKFIANCYNNLLSANGSYEDDRAPFTPRPPNERTESF